MYVYIYIYIYIYIHVYMYIYVYIYISICKYVNMRFCIYVYLFLDICVFMNEYIFVYVYMYIFVYICVRTHTHTERQEKRLRYTVSKFCVALQPPLETWDLVTLFAFNCYDYSLEYSSTQPWPNISNELVPIAYLPDCILAWARCTTVMSSTYTKQTSYLSLLIEMPFPALRYTQGTLGLDAEKLPKRCSILWTVSLWWVARCCKFALASLV